MSERWKPENGERYYFVDYNYHGSVGDQCWGTLPSYDSKFYGVGNVFKTEEDAEAAAEKVKAFLLSLHEEQPATDCTQLPKLTTEVFDLADCPKWAKYAAVDENGLAFYYRDIPRKACETWRVDSVLYYQEIPGEWDASDWEHSLIDRPVKLTDWCRVGEWVYWRGFAIGGKYFKIAKISDGILFDKTGVAHNHIDTKPARLRPYNANELKALVGKVIGNEHGSMFLVTAFVADDEGAVCVDGVTYNSDDLLEQYTIDGKLCGVLEHLNDKGEWVE